MKSTDDAYITAETATLAAKVSGYVASVEVPTMRHVKTGDVIAHIDDGDYRSRCSRPRTTLPSSRPAIDRIGRQVAAQEAALDQAKAQLTSAEAGSGGAARS